MLSSNKNIDQLQELAQDLFRRVQLQKRYVQLDIVKKLTILLSAFVIGAVVFLLGAIVVVYLSYLCVLLFTDWLGSVAGACGLVCLVFVVLAAVFYTMRRRLVVNPLAAFLAKLFLDPKNKS